MFKKKNESVKQCFKDLHWLNIDQRISFKVILLVFKCIHNLAPLFLQNHIKIKDHDKDLLSVDYFPVTNIGRRAFKFFAPRQWNCLPDSLRIVDTLPAFNAHLKTHLFNDYASFCQKYNKFGNLSGSSILLQVYVKMPHLVLL